MSKIELLESANIRSVPVFFWPSKEAAKSPIYCSNSSYCFYFYLPYPCTCQPTSTLAPIPVPTSIPVPTLNSVDILVAVPSASGKKLALFKAFFQPQSTPQPDYSDDYHLVKMSNIVKTMGFLPCACGSPVTVKEDRSLRRGLFQPLQYCLYLDYEAD